MLLGRSWTDGFAALWNQQEPRHEGYGRDTYVELRKCPRESHASTLGPRSMRPWIEFVATTTGLDGST